MDDTDPFPSLAALKTAHRELIAQRRQGIDDQFLNTISQFIERGCKTGCFLEQDDDRWDAQNLLDYWSNELFHNERQPPDATLDEFDPSQTPQLLDTQCPYQGLDAFHSQDHDYFFGRDAIVKQMLAILENGRFLAIVGPSGSGKSSTALAGLLPLLQQAGLPGSEKWTILPTLMPGANPLESTANILFPQTPSLPQISQQFTESPAFLAGYLNQNYPAGAVLIIDQFEELYTLCHNSHLRQVFVDNLIGVLQQPQNLHTLIITMRSDKESNLMRTAVFQGYYAQNQVRLTPMDASQLRTAIAKPAELAGLQFEEGLIDQLVRDVLGEPSALPLLQFTLLKLWESRNHNRVTWEAYRRLGGGRQAIAKSANTFFNNLPAADRPIVQQMLLQLVQFSLGPDVARDRIFKRELYSIAADQRQIDRLMQELSAIRLVRLIRGTTPNEDKVELAHEALLTHWPRLAGWLEEARVTQRRRVQLSGMAQQWESLNHDPSTLLRGLLLEEALQYDNLDDVETAFVNVSIQVRDREVQLREEARKKQLEQAQILAQERQLRLNEKDRLTKWLGNALVALAVVFAVALVAGILAAQNANTAQRSEMTAVASERLALANESTAVANQAVADTLRETAVANAAQLAVAEANARQERDQATENEQLALLAQETAVASFQEADNARATAEAIAVERDIQFRLATSRELANNALDQLTNNPQLSVQLALESIYFPLKANQEPPIETTDVLYRALLASQLQDTLSGHTGWVTDVAISPDGAWVATSSNDGTARVWQTSTGQEHQRIERHVGNVNSVAFSLDSSLLATAGDDGYVYVWNMSSFGLLAALPDEDNGAVQAVVFHPDGRQLVAAYADSTIRIWDTAARQSQVRLFGHTDIVNDVALNISGSRLATASTDGSVIVWDVETGAPQFSIELDESVPKTSANAVAFHPDGTRLVVGYADGVSRLWEGQTFLMRMPGHTNFVTDVAFSHDGRFIATTGGDGIIRVWESKRGQVDYTIMGHSGEATAVQFAPDDSQLITVGQDNSAKIWNATPGIRPLMLTGHSAAVQNVAFNADGSQVVTVSADRTALVWDAETGEIRHVFAQHNDTVNDAAFDPTNQLVATASSDAIVRLWYLEDDTVYFLLHANAVNALAFSPDGTQIATAGQDGIVRIWDVASRVTVNRLLLDAPINALAYHPSGDWLAIGDENGNLHLWSPITSQPELLSEHTGPIEGIAFHPDGTQFISASSDGTARLWSAEGEPLRTFTGHSGPILSVAFHPGGELAATTGADRSVKLWNTTSGQNVRTYFGHSSTVTAVDFTPDGSHMVTAGVDRTAQINKLLTVQELFERAWSQIHTPMSQEDCRRFLHGFTCITMSLPGPLPSLISTPTP